MQIEWFFVVFMMNITFWLVHIVQTCQGNVASSLVVPDHDQCDCQSGVWNSGLKIGFFSVASPVGVNNITWARYCALGHYGQGGGSQIYPVAGPDGEGKYLWQTNTLGGPVMINCF